MRYTTACVLSMIAGSLLACERQEQAETPMTPAAFTAPVEETAPVVEDTVDKLASASCDHQQRCNRIGEKAKYSSREQCVNIMRTEARDELDDVDCRQGVDQSDLQECLAEIQNQDCSGLLDKFEQLIACRADDLCD